MNNNDNSLLDFLKKKSLFSYSPSKSSKRSRSRSHQSQKFAQKVNNEANREDFELNQKIMNIASYEDQTALNKQSRFVGNFSYQHDHALQGQENYRKFPIYRSDATSSFKKNSDFSQGIEERDNKLWKGLSSYGQNFESARLESAHCLENLAQKISKQIETIDAKIEVFNSRMYRLLNSQFKAIQERIYKVVQLSFKESQKWIREYIKQKEQMLTGQLVKAKSFLEKELLKIESMNQQLKKTNWRKVAGEILSTQLQKRVEDTLKETKVLQIGEWKLQNYAQKHVRIIQEEIKTIFSLKS